MDDLKNKVDDDIVFAQQQWDKYSHDYEKMESVYNKLLFSYNDLIHDFSKELIIISSYENKNRLADVYRKNVNTLIHRLVDFQNNGYENKTDGSLSEYEYKKQLTNLFNEVRFDISNDDKILNNEKEDILENIDNIEQITLLPQPKEKRWELIRPIIVWLSGKSLKGAGYIFRILEFIGKE